ncbi:MAG: right-handed parallel beta-helix repeat-containing protein [Patescibacteria group bacterium]|nr:right-handed parallel beta-helix repeat-containing protein [Patescibacteria group bacterium]
MLKNLKYLFALLACALALPLAAGAETQVGGGSITNPVWTPESSPYVISGTLEVASGALLKIMPGAEVRFNAGAKLLINGELQILGTASDPVMMTLNTASSTSGLWSGIEFGPNSVDAVMADGVYKQGSTVQGAIIKFSEGIKLNDASPYIANNQFSNNSVGVNVYGTAGSAGGLVLDSLSAGSNATKIKPLYIVNNTFSDNSVGIIINRNNGRDYVVTPVGYSYIGNKVVTSYIKGNTITGSSVGVQITNGDNNVIVGNIIRYNTGAAITAAAASRGNVLQGNELNNNLLGAVISSADSYIAQNNIKNNSDTGLMIGAKPLFLSYNNFYNNKKYNLNNGVYMLSAENNYWGSSDSTEIAATMLTLNASSTYPVDYDPFFKEESSTSSLLPPFIEAVERSTTASLVYLSGLKPAGMAVYINDSLLDVGRDENSWMFKADLKLGENDFSIYYQDANGNNSSRQNISIQRYDTLAAPTVNSYEKTTTLAKITLTGTKPAGSSLLLDGQEIKPASDETVWTYNFDLSLGDNAWSLTAYDAVSKQTSLAAGIKVVRTKDTVAETIAAEKAATKTVDAKLAARLAGRLLLQVEKGGVIWYVNPGDNKRYLVTLDNALSLFRSLSLGISEANLEKLPTPESKQKGDAALMKRLAGKLLLRVEKAGTISYIDYQGYRHDVTRENLMDLFRSLSLGISNENIYKIAIGETK